jgi:hypothetical protein
MHRRKKAALRLHTNSLVTRGLIRGSIPMGRRVNPGGPQSVIQTTGNRSSAGPDGTGGSVLQLARQWALPFAGQRQLVSILISILRLPRFLFGWQRARPVSRAPAGSAARRRDRLREATFDLHDFHQAAWLGRLVAKSRPSVHADIGSRATDIGMLSGFVQVIFVDQARLHVHAPGLASVAGDITCLPFPDKSLVSVSSLHAVGHVGPGRHGDPTEPTEALKALGELQRVLGYRGSLYLSVPVGRERVGSRAQRIFAPETILVGVPFLRLRRFSYVGDDGEFHADAPLDEAATQEYGCGLFEFERG